MKSDILFNIILYVSNILSLSLSSLDKRDVLKFSFTLTCSIYDFLMSLSKYQIHMIINRIIYKCFVVSVVVDVLDETRFIDIESVMGCIVFFTDTIYTS
jgi:hypothetical protein